MNDYPNLHNVENGVGGSCDR